MPDNESTPLRSDPDGYKVLTKAVSELLNAYPGLEGTGLDDGYGDVIPFEKLAENGITFSASNGALVMTERRSITDYVKQKCRFPFFVVFRTSTKDSGMKLYVQTFLDTLGKWLCKEPTEYENAVYPALSDGRKITRVTRDNSYGVEPDPSGYQDWLLPVTIEYTNEFQL